jgi:uncharacterized protein
MILKVLLIVGVIALVYFIFFKTKPLKNTPKKESKNSPDKASDMIECSTCQVYTEISECILSDGKYYCSTECISKAK